MEFVKEKDRIWYGGTSDEPLAYVEFPEFEEGKVEVTHTVVDPSLGGQGLAGRLNEEMAKQLREEGRKAELTCSYTISWFGKHPEYSDVLIDPDTAAEKSDD